ncbi:MAG: hypothetical protein O7F71_13280, partial [Gammaproteobacteria bacterium]|nr:hypothetical protein [Gammaproteobacteria bacterium]
MPQETDQDRDELITIYREGSDEQPPAELDAAILAAAGQALIPWYRRPTVTAISTAAVVVLAVSLILINPDFSGPGNEPFSTSTQLPSPRGAEATGTPAGEADPVTGVSAKATFDQPAGLAPPLAEELPQTQDGIAELENEPSPLRVSLTSSIEPPVPAPALVDADAPRQRSDIPASASPPPVNQLRTEELDQLRKTLIESQRETFLELEPEST